MLTKRVIGPWRMPDDRMIWHLEGPAGGESQAEVTGRFLPGYGLHGVGVHFVYLSRRELPRAVKAFMDFNVMQIRERGLSDTRPSRTKRRLNRNAHP